MAGLYINCTAHPATCFTTTPPATFTFSASTPASLMVFGIYLLLATLLSAPAFIAGSVELTLLKQSRHHRPRRSSANYSRSVTRHQALTIECQTLRAREGRSDLLACTLTLGLVLWTLITACDIFGSALALSTSGDVGGCWVLLYMLLLFCGIAASVFMVTVLVARAGMPTLRCAVPENRMTKSHISRASIPAVRYECARHEIKVSVGTQVVVMAAMSVALGAAFSDGDVLWRVVSGLCFGMALGCSWAWRLAVRVRDRVVQMESGGGWWLLASEPSDSELRLADCNEEARLAGGRWADAVIWRARGECWRAGGDCFLFLHTNRGRSARRLAVRYAGLTPLCIAAIPILRSSQPPVTGSSPSLPPSSPGIRKPASRIIPANST